MNEITRIHLAKTPYNIEIQAHAVLRSYLDAIEKALHADVDAMREIESRMTELLTDRGVNGDTVITIADVEALQKQLGDPKDFAGDETSDDLSGAQAPKKKLMRDTSNAMLAGVCSGIAAYFGWDAVWVRIAAVVLIFITSGTMILIYIILAVVMPKAKSAADRLEMTGTAVTLSALKETAAQATEGVEPVLTKVLRLSFGAAFAAAAMFAVIGVVGGVGYIIKNLNEFSFYNGDFKVGLSTALMALGGVMLAVLCSLIAKMLFMRSLAKNLIIGAVIVTIVGAASFGSGAAITVFGINAAHIKASTSNVTKQLDVNSELDGVKKIDIRSRSIDLHYDVSDTKRMGSYAYSSFMIENPSVKLTRMGDTLVIESKVSEAGMCRSKLAFCTNLVVELNLTGPALEHIKTNASNTTYAAIQQDTLLLEQQPATDVVLTSIGSIGTLNVQTADGSLTATDATIVTANLNGTRGSTTFANVAAINVTAQTESCSEPLTISASHVGTLQVNGQSWNTSTQYPCLALQVDNHN